MGGRLGNLMSYVWECETIPSQRSTTEKETSSERISGSGYGNDYGRVPDSGDVRGESSPLHAY